MCGLDRGQSLPLIGMVLFLGVVFGWRPWLQRRRHGTSGILFLRSGDWRQRLRDALGIVLFACLLGQAIVAVAQPESPSLLRASVGAIVMFGGLVFLVTAQLNLGASWRIGIDEGARTGLVVTGFCRFCRNPIYLAILVFFAGYTILLPTRLSLLLLLGYFIGMRQQTLGEEAYLLRTHGDAYRDYARRVGRFLPGIGRLSWRRMISINLISPEKPPVGLE